MLKLFLQITGWCLAHTPQFILQVLAWSLGHAVFFLLRRRRRLFFSNLDHAFPNRTRRWQASIARQSSCRFVETAFLSLASPFMSDARLRRLAAITPETLRYFADHHSQAYPLVVAAPHIAYWESLTTLGLFLDVPLPEFGVVFRPLDNPTADAWVKSTRERHGMRLLSRKDGLAEAFRILRRKGVVGVLFDQNAGLQGALTTLFGRVCSTSELAGMLVERSGARIVAFYPRRLGFWKLQLESEEIFHDGTTAGALFALNRWLETKLSADDNLCASWLWSHDRWRHQDMPEKRLRLESRRDLLPAELSSRGLSALPRKTRIFIRMPNWLGDVVMALPLLRALRLSRPDAELTLIAKASFLPLLRDWGVADRLEALPSTRGPAYFLHFWKLRHRQPDAYLLFTNSLRGDIEAWLTRCRQRFGMVRPGKQRPLLSHRFPVPQGFDERQHHQLELWESFLAAFGLKAPADRSPLGTGRTGAPQAAGSSPTIGLIAGSENNPEKRWPVEHWRTLTHALARAYPGATLLLLGTANDRPITAAIARDAATDQVHDLAGRTNLNDYVARLRSCDLLVTNDTGGMHLANALGVPLLALFGPTNPVRTGPVFSSAWEVLQPPGCPKTGGASLVALSPDTVLAAALRLLAHGSPVQLATP